MYYSNKDKIIRYNTFCSTFAFPLFCMRIFKIICLYLKMPVWKCRNVKNSISKFYHDSLHSLGIHGGITPPPPPNYPLHSLWIHGGTSAIAPYQITHFWADQTWAPLAKSHLWLKFISEYILNRYTLNVMIKAKYSIFQFLSITIVLGKYSHEFG